MTVDARGAARASSLAPHCRLVDRCELDWLELRHRIEGRAVHRMGRWRKLAGLCFYHGRSESGAPAHDLNRVWQCRLTEGFSQRGFAMCS
jgi:hypothetical protein